MAKFGVKTTSTEAAEAFDQYIKGKTVLVTGVTKNGLGLEAARAISLHSPKLIILAARSDDRLQEAAEEIRNAAPEVQTKGLKLDLSSLTSVRKAANEVNNYPDDIVIDVLINNAAIMAVPWSLSPDGYELQFATNHLGHFLFTNLIIPRILKAAKQGRKPRIINVSSHGHRRSPVRFDDWNFGGDGSTYADFVAYGQSKTANILTAVALADKLRPRNVLAYSLHPGIIWTNLGVRASKKANEEMKDLGILDENFEPKENGMSVWKTLEQGASTTICAAFDPSIEGRSGAYLSDCNIDDEGVRDYAVDKGNAQRLWKLSEELVGQKFEY